MKDSSGEENWRTKFIRNENLIYVTEDDYTDVYQIKEPAEIHDKSKLYVTVNCPHISEELRTKNLQKYFDDTNGIDTCNALIKKALAGSGWKVRVDAAGDEYFDSFKEEDGTTERVRSYSCDTKTGTYNMIAGICELFDARPVFNGLEKTVEIYSMSNTEGMMEINFGKNADKIKRIMNSSSLVTRLYVEGEYGDFGYVGIDKENDGLPFILNFDYYKELGCFTSYHEKLVEDYKNDYVKYSSSITSQTTEQLKNYAALVKLIGIYRWVYYPIVSGEVDKGNLIAGSDVIDGDTNLSFGTADKPGDMVMVVGTNYSYVHVRYENADLDGKLCMIKFIPTTAGTFAATEDKIASCESGINSLLTKLNKHLKREAGKEVTLAELNSVYGDDLSIVNDESYDVSGLGDDWKTEVVRSYVASIGKNENSIEGLKVEAQNEMQSIVKYMQDIGAGEAGIKNASDAQAKIDDDFADEMGFMLRDGYWSDDKYTVGQEKALYQDANKISEKLAFPISSYEISIQNLAVKDEYKGEDFKLAQNIHIWDKYTGMNDYGVVTKMIVYPQKPTADAVTVSSDMSDVANRSLASILERVTEMAEQMRRNRAKYERAAALSKEGKFSSDMLEGAIDVAKTQLMSTISNWKTDEKGNIVFEAVNGEAAMMLCGAGFMIANEKTESGEWNWRTFGTGDGFTADMIVTGQLNSNVIEAQSITANKLASDVGASLDLSSNTSITQTVKNEVKDQIAKIEIDGESIVSSVIDAEEFEEAVLSITADEISQQVENNDTISSFSQTAEKVQWLIRDADDTEEEPDTSFTISQKGIEAIVTNINLKAGGDITLDAKNITGTVSENFKIKAGNNVSIEADVINQVADQINLKSNTTILENEDLLKAVADKVEIDASSLEIDASSLNLSLNEGFNILLGKVKNLEGTTPMIFRRDDAPSIEEAKENALWVCTKTGSIYKEGLTYQAVKAQTSNIKNFTINDDGTISYELEGSDPITEGQLYIDDDGHLKLDNDRVSLWINENGELVEGFIWVHVQDRDLLDMIEAQNKALEALETDVKKYTDDQLDALKQEVEGQIDGKAETWFYAYTPTDNNYPANSWTTDEDKKAHAGDLFYNIAENTVQKWDYDEENNTCYWVETNDVNLNAFSEIANTKAALDGKMTVFTSQPKGPYQTGDLWVTKETASGTQIESQVIKYCITDNNVVDGFNSSHWVVTSNYVTQAEINSFIAVATQDLQTQIDSKVETFFLSGEPSTTTSPANTWTTDDLKSAHTGDLYYDTSGNHAYRWTGTSWAKISDQDTIDALAAAEKASDTADGKRRVFVSNSLPTPPYDVGDLWRIGSDTDLRICINAKVSGAEASDNDWEIAFADTAAREEAAQYRNYIAQDEEDGILRLGTPNAAQELQLDPSGVAVAIDGKQYSKFASNYVQFGNQQMRQSADGGLVFKLKKKGT